MTAIRINPNAGPDLRPVSHCLVVVHTRVPGLLGKRFMLDAGSARVGRGVLNEIVLEEEGVSERHAHTERAGERWQIVDDGSAHGTLLNDAPIEGEVTLSAGDRIQIGSTVLKLLSGPTVETEYDEEVGRLSILDSLTQLYNERSFLEALRREMTRARRHERDLAIILFDIDHFERIHEGHGHLVGDAALAGIARRISTLVRRDETLARHGGSELAVVMPETSLEEAARQADHVRRHVAGHVFEVRRNEIRVTLSAGVAALRDDDDALSLIDRAGARLHAAKNGGGDRVCW